jgi:REP element-mobilizing transposase RayT
MLSPKLQKYKNQNPSAHGGDLSKNVRKTRRALATSCTMHIVMRSIRAKGEWSMLKKRHKSKIAFLLRDTAKRYGIKLHGFQNVGNHLHIHVQTPSRRAWQNFLRVLPQRIMFAVTGARRGNPKGRFWTLLAFSRIVEWGREYAALKLYFWKNSLEALGLPRPIIDFLAQKKRGHELPPPFDHKVGLISVG